MNNRIKKSFKGLLWFLEGIIVGFGAIMPGLSGGTLCVAFGMYLPLIWVISHPRENIRKYGKMLAVFGMGVAVGFIGLSGFASWLMDLSSELVICAFVGFIIGTFPELWEDAGVKGRNTNSYISMAVGFAVMLMLLSKAVNAAYNKYYGIISHAIIGVVAATTVMILPDWNVVGIGQIICIVCGALVSYAFTRICVRLKK